MKRLFPKELEHELLECIEARGPWPFITRIAFRAEGRSPLIWNSRLHRKRLEERQVEVEHVAQQILRCLWAPRDLNWWIGSIFALGSFLFALASVLNLRPAWAAACSLSTMEVNAIFFIGSVPFSTAAYLQLFQAANTPDFVSPSHESSKNRRAIFGWKPPSIGWLGCAFQFVGTLLFNLNTFDAMIPGLTWMQQDLWIWTPDLIGSILFLFSGYLAFVEICHAHFAWKPRSLSWWVTLVNLFGCIGFMIAALFAVVLPSLGNAEMTTLAIGFTLQGAICFFIGSCLMLPETGIGTKV